MLSLVAKLWPFQTEGTVQQRIDRAIYHHDKKEATRREDSLRRSQALDLEQFIDKPVICISDAATNPIIGFGVRVEFITQAQNPILVVKDYIMNDEFLVFSSIFAYTEQRYEVMVNKLTACERAAMVCRNRTMPILATNADEDLLLTPGETYEQLYKNGFFKKLQGENHE